MHRKLLHYLDHIEGQGVDLFHLACGLDLEGIVAKPKGSAYRSEQKPWIKVKNASYSQAEGRRELFDSRSGVVLASRESDRNSLTTISIESVLEIGNKTCIPDTRVVPARPAIPVFVWQDEFVPPYRVALLRDIDPQ